MARKKCAFTLAEVLITLGIIGVVAALTIPTLMQSYQKKQYVSGFQKAWGILTNAFELSEAHNGFINTWDEPTSCSDINYLEKYWVPYFNISKNCKLSTGQGCWAKETSFMDGTAAPHNDYLDQYKILLTDGMSINFCPVIDGRKDNHSITIDINGLKGPNIYGRDIFRFSVDAQAKQKIFPRNNNSKTFEELKEDCISEGSSCGAYLVKNGYKMDY